MNYSRFYDGDYPEELAYVVAFDPGETTGFCIMGIHRDQLRGGPGVVKELHHGIVHIEYGEIDCITGNGTGFDSQMNNHAGIALEQEAMGVHKMWMLSQRFPQCPIVFEDFVPDQRMDKDRHTVSPIRITAMLSYNLWLQGNNDNPLFVQNKSLAKTTCTDKRLRHWGLYDLHSGPHARDATRHAYYHLRCCRGSDIKAKEKRWRSWPHLFNDPQNESSAKPKKAKKLGERVEGLL